MCAFCFAVVDWFRLHYNGWWCNFHCKLTLDVVILDVDFSVIWLFLKISTDLGLTV